MKFEALVRKDFAHPPEKVWQALSEPAAIAVWLMKNEGFRPEIGCRFRLFCVDSEGHVDTYHCEVLEVEAPRRMVWSWLLEGEEEDAATRVTIELEETTSGTLMTLRHAGNRDPRAIEMFRQGWPAQLKRMGAMLDQAP